jgi:hypothetical protein
MKTHAVGPIVGYCSDHGAALLSIRVPTSSNSQSNPFSEYDHFEDYAD